MKFLIKIMLFLTCSSALFASQPAPSVNLNQLEDNAKQVGTDFKGLQEKINIPVVSQSIVTQDAAMLKDALQDVIQLNRTITAQIDTAIGFWNLYLDSVPMPNKETYLLGQVMSSFLGTMRSLFLRSNLDQAMILSLIKKNFDHTQATELKTAVDAQEVKIEDRWKNLHM